MPIVIMFFGDLGFDSWPCLNTWGQTILDTEPDLW